MSGLAILALALVPLGASAVAASGGRWTRWLFWGALAFEAGLLARGPEAEVVFIGARWTLEPLGRLALLIGLGVAALGGLVGQSKGDRAATPAESWPVAPVLAALGLAAAALLVRDNLPSSVLLLEAVALAVVLVIARGEERVLGAAVRYAILASLASLAMLVGAALSTASGDGTEIPRTAIGLLVVGLGLLTAVFPFSLWLPGVVEEGEPADAPLVLAFVSTPAVVIVAGALRASTGWAEWLPGGRALLAAAIASAIVAALLTFGQSPARRLACLTSSSLAFGLAGLTMPGDVGLIGGALTVLAVPPACLLASLCLRQMAPAGTRERRPGDGELRGLTVARPMSKLGLAIGVLSLAGAPLLAGFPGRWAVYTAALAVSEWYLLGLLVATLCAMVAAGTMLYPMLWAAGTGHPRPAALTTRAAVAGLCLAIVALGLYPAPVVFAIQSALGYLAQ